MTLKMTCANCGKSATAPDNAVGRVGKCPKCGAQIALVAAVPGTPQGVSLATIKAFAKRNAASIIAVVALGLIPVFVVVGWLLLRSPKTKTPEPDVHALAAPAEATPEQERQPDIFDELAQKYGPAKVPENPRPATEPVAKPPQEPTGPLSPAEVYAAAEKAVVVIRSICSEDGSLDGQGSGFFLHPGDVIVTNAHVVREAYALEIKTRDGKTARITSALALDDARDVAVLPVPDALRGTPSLKAASGLPRVGERVYALGAPKGLEYTFADGLVSQIRQGVPGYNTLIQTNTSISPGSSGGPLLNARAEVVGITTLGSRAIADANNLNFAVAASEVFNVCKSKCEPNAAIPLNANLAEAYCSRGADKCRRFDCEGAIADLNKAIAIDPKNAYAYYFRGEAEKLKGDIQGANRDFATARKLGYSGEK